MLRWVGEKTSCLPEMILQCCGRTLVANAALPHLRNEQPSARTVEP